LPTAGGQFFSAVVGCVCRDIFPDSVNWVAAPVGVGLSVLVMQITRTVHPPGETPELACASTVWRSATVLLPCYLMAHGSWVS
jgi:CBS-domain-containing membrane protein